MNVELYTLHLKWVCFDSPQEFVVLTFYCIFQMLVNCITLELVVFICTAVRNFTSHIVHFHLCLQMYTYICQHDDIYLHFYNNFQQLKHQ